MTARAVLKNSTWFKDLPDSALDEMAALSEVRNYGPGEVVFRRGDRGDYLYGVITGQVRITTSSADGRELGLNTMGAGTMGGEIAVFDGGPRTASWTTTKPTTVFVIPRAGLQALMLRQPSIALHVIELLCQRVRTSTLQVEDVAFHTVPQRLARRLQLLGSDEGAEHDGSGNPGAYTVHFSQSDLAGFLNASRQAVNKVLQGWQKRGFVELGRGRVTVKDLAGIMAHVAEDSGTWSRPHST